MATRLVLAELAAVFERTRGRELRVVSIGGVDAARRVRDGERFDGVVLAAAVIDSLIAEGKALAGSRVDLMHSGVSIAVPEGAPRPDVGDEDAVRQAVLAAPSIGYSTGPSGVHLIGLFEHWGIADAIRSRLVQAPSGVPVARLLAEGRVTLGFQQLSELLHVPGITVVGPLPPSIQITTTFSGAVAATCAESDAALAVLQFMGSEACADAKRRHGMEPA